jgi:cystinosin
MSHSPLPSRSFYPQVFLNHSRKSVLGLSFEFQAYNITGFLFYSTYCLSNYLVQHDSSLHLVQSVEVNDLLFAFHAVLITGVVILQCLIYRTERQSVHWAHAYLLGCFWLIFLYNCVLAAAGILPFVNRLATYQYSVVEYLGYVKIAISFIKYCPQAYMNYARGSTEGWSIGNVLLDLTGGLLAFGQQGLDAYRAGDTTLFTSNIAKLALSCESVVFDLLFIVQHYVIYRGVKAAVVDFDLTRDEERGGGRAKEMHHGSSGGGGGVEDELLDDASPNSEHHHYTSPSRATEESDPPPLATTSASPAAHLQGGANWSLRDKDQRTQLLTSNSSSTKY